MRYELKQFDIKSMAKVYGALLGALYLIVGSVFFVVSVITSLFQDGFTWIGVASALLSLVLLIVLSVLFGALSGVFMAWVYNKIVGYIGGIQIEFVEAKEPAKSKDE